MKTYDEMTRSIMSRAKAHRAARNRWIGGSVAAVCALGLCIGMMAMKPSEPTPKTLSVTEAPAQSAPVQPTEAPIQPIATPARVTFLYSDGIETKSMEQGISVPLASELRVRYMNGMTQAEREALKASEIEYAEKLCENHPDKKGYDWAQTGNDDVVITSINAGHFVLGVEDPTQLERIEFSVKGVLQLCYLPDAGDGVQIGSDPNDSLEYLDQMEYVLSGEELEDYFYEPYGGYEFTWMPSSGLVMKLYDPSTSLCEYSDTISIAVTFRDGTVEYHAIDVIFNDNGTVYAIQRGAATAS